MKYWVEDTCRASFKASQLLKQRETVTYEQEVQEENGEILLGMDVDFNPDSLHVNDSMPMGSGGPGLGMQLQGL